MLILDEFKKMLGVKAVNAHTDPGVREVLKLDAHLVTYQEFNELLAYLGWPKVSPEFFQHFFAGEFSTVEGFARGVEQVRIHAMLFWGSFSQGFLELAKYTRVEEFNRVPWDMKLPHDRPVLVDKIKPLTGEQGHVTGYLTDQENPLSQGQRQTAINIAKRNAERYLAMDFVDVYLAGSMRSLSDFQSAATFVRTLRAQPELRQLRLSFFNPLWSYMEDSQQKGLLEQLMLEKANAMVYSAGEVDSFGKDSELASMLVQGKPVIVYVPHPPAPNANASQEDIEAWAELKDRLDRRFAAFANTHPLRIQCDLRTGVANGVMVCRDVGMCAQLLYGIFTNTLEFRIDDDDSYNVFLREPISNSAVRVVTRNQFLTDSFWNQWFAPSVTSGVRYAP